MTAKGARSANVRRRADARQRAAAATSPGSHTATYRGVRLPAPHDADSKEGGDIYAEIREVIPNSEAWLRTPHVFLYGHTPGQLIKSGHEEMVRELLHAIVHVGVT